MRGDELKLEPGDRLINVYGGSTTYDIGLKDDDTWSHRLQVKLGKGFVVANHGVPGYSTAEHVIRTAFYSGIAGKKPDCSIYYIGWNDIRNAHIRPLDPGYANFHLLTQFDSLNVRANKLGFPFPGSFSALKNSFDVLSYDFARQVAYAADAVPPAPSFEGFETKRGPDKELDAIFVRNVETIISINRARNIVTVFIPQMLNRSRLTGDGVYGWIPLVKDKDVWELQEYYNKLLRDTAVANGADFIDVDVELFSDEDFVDNGHFSSHGSLKFVNMITSRVRAVCAG